MISFPFITIRGTGIHGWQSAGSLCVQVESGNSNAKT
jgi:hypothetical protein